MVPVDKRLIVVAAMLGAMTTFSLGSEAYVKQYASRESFDGLLAVSKYVTLMGSIGQFILFRIVAFVIIAQRSRHSWQSALLFFLCANFFFPQYLIANGAAGSFIFACNTPGHGVQYCAFLGFHAGNDYEKRERSGGDLSRYLMPAAFLAIAIFLGDLYVFDKVVSLGGAGPLSPVGSDRRMGWLLRSRTPLSPESCSITSGWIPISGGSRMRNRGIGCSSAFHSCFSNAPMRRERDRSSKLRGLAHSPRAPRARFPATAPSRRPGGWCGA